MPYLAGFRFAILHNVKSLFFYLAADEVAKAVQLSGSEHCMRAES